MEIYDYYTANGLHKYGYRVYTTDDKTELSYEAAGFDSYSEAEADMKITSLYLEIGEGFGNGCDSFA